MNDCNFSHDRVYRYSLTHKWKTLFPGKAITWIGLNPSTADELELDRTLKRIKSFSTLWGYNTFHMLNLFAFRATDPEIMKKQPDPVGPDNDRCLSGFCSKSKCIVAVWGNHGNHIDRSETVLNSILKDFDIHYLKLTGSGMPGHPLYIGGDTILKNWADRLKNGGR